MIGRDRITLLEAVAEHKNIVKAAESVGTSYKSAMDAVVCINNLLPRPALEHGSCEMGDAEITQEGLRLIEAFRSLERHLLTMPSAIADDGCLDERSLLLGVGVQISARNAFRCTVVALRKAPVDVDVILRLSDTRNLVATVTNRSVKELGLAPGKTVIAFVKASLVEILPGYEQAIFTENAFQGTVLKRDDGDKNSEILIGIDSGKIITAVVAKDRADEFSIVEGMLLTALFLPSHVILASD